MKTLSGLGLLVLAGVISGIGSDTGGAPVGSPTPLSSLDSLIAEGESSYWEGEFDAARTSWSMALGLSRRTGSDRSEARVLTWLGLVAYRTGDYDEAKRLGEEALAIKLRLGPGSEISRSYNALGLLAWTQGQLGDAAILFGKATDSARRENELEMLAKTANNLGLVYSDQGEFARARASFQASRTAGSRLGDPVIEGRSLSNLGMLEVQVGDPSTGITLLKLARRKYAETSDVAGEANTMGQLATAYTAVGEPGLAFAVLDSALSLSRNHGMTSEVASALDLLGDLYLRTGDRPKALELIGQARSMYRDLGLAIEEGIELAREARIQAALGDENRARSLALEALAFHRSTGSVLEEFGDLLLLAEIEYRTDGRAASDRRLAEARTVGRALESRAARVDLALTAARIADRREDPETGLAALDGAAKDLDEGSYAEIAESENLRARAHARLGDYPAAVVAGRRAVTAIERTRQRLESGFLRTTFLAESRQPYADLIDALLHLSRTEEAFTIADAARGRAFQDYLAAVPERAVRGDPSIGVMTEKDRLLREIDRLVRLRDEVEAVASEDAGLDDRETVRELTYKLDRARARFEELIVRGAESNSARSGLLESRPAGVAEIRRALADDEGLIEYFVALDHVLAFVASRDEMEALRLDLSKEDVVRRVAVARDLAGTHPGSPRPPPQEALESLHELLLAPLLEAKPLRGVSRLLFVLDGPLANLPVAALRDPGTGRYLVESHVLLFLPSAGALPILRATNRESPSEDMESIAVYAPFPTDLPGTMDEARAIAGSRRRTGIVAGRRATEGALRKELTKRRVVHVASHGTLEAKSPFFSRIELYRKGEDPDDDGRLEVHEVLGLTIRSPLVFLSGCETEPGASALGAEGEDYATLARAFLYAGAAGVIATQWRIDDDAAARLASSFYTHLSSKGPADALALAQRDMIRANQYASPYYWAPYRMAGAEVQWTR